MQIVFKLRTRWSCNYGTGRRQPQRIFIRESIILRLFSSNQAFKNTYGLPFTVAPDDALNKFRTWASRDQGLSPTLLGQNIGITAAYCPVWTFDLNLMFLDKENRRTIVPEPFAKAFPDQTILHLPGLSAYAGYTYRRTLLDPVHTTTLLFLGHEHLGPFHSYMLRDMQLRDGTKLMVFPDPWNATQGRALQVIRRLLANMAADREQLELKTELVKARRVYMPTYVINYKVFGAEYQAILSGYDTAAPVSGISHTLFDSSSTTAFKAFAMNAGTAAHQIAGVRGLVSILSILLQFMGSLATRILVRVPLVAAIGGVFFGFRKFIRPWIDNRAASAEWQRQRDHEAMTPNATSNDFTDTFRVAERFFQANRTRILRSLSGEEAHGRGTYDWYTAWEKWSRQQWEQQQQTGGQQNQYSYGQQQYGQQRSSSRGQSRSSPRQRQESRQDFKWDFDPSDPYVGISECRIFVYSLLPVYPVIQYWGYDEERL